MNCLHMVIDYVPQRQFSDELYRVALDVPTFLVHNRSSVAFYRKENMKTKILLAQNSQFLILFNYELSVKLNKVSR